MSSTGAELRLANERHLKHQGTVKVDISQISFDKLSPSSEKLERLRRIFREEGCLRENVRNHVPCLVSHGDLLNALQRAGLTQAQLHTNIPEQYPHLEFADGRLRGVHGFHRIEIGRQLLPPSDRWWTVDLYLDDISDDLHTTIHEEYSNEKRPDDGEAYCKTRRYQREGNVQFQRRWWARLSEVKAARLRQLWRNDILSSKFDDLLVFPGVWEGMRLGSLGKVLGMKCVEELVSYLTHIKEAWLSFVGSESAMLKITRHDVKMLELKAPGACVADARQVEGWVLSGEVFRNFTRQERDDIWSRMKQFGGLIPSLYTFFEDCKYLETCAHCLHRLVEVPRDSTLRQAMMHIFMDNHRGQRDFALQTADDQFTTVSAGTERRFELAYRQLWLYAMRHQHKVGREAKGKGYLARPKIESADEKALYGAAFLAQKSGLVSPQITKLVAENPDRLMAQHALLKARDQSCYQYEPEEFETLVNTIVGCFAAAKPRNPEPSPELHEQSVTNIKFRCGIPPTEINAQDSRYLFIDQIDTREVSINDGVASLFVRRCVFHAFLGRPTVCASRSEECPVGDSNMENVTSSIDTDMEAQPSNSGQVNRAAEESRQRAEEEARQREIQQKAEEETRQREIQRKAEEEARKKAEEEARQREIQRKAEEEARQREIQRKAEEEARQREIQRKAEEEARQREIQRKAEEEARQREIQRKAEEEARQRAIEKARQNAEEAQWRAAKEAGQRAKEEAREAWQKAAEEAQQRTEDTQQGEKIKITFKQLFKDKATGKYTVDERGGYSLQVTRKDNSQVEKLAKKAQTKHGKLFPCKKDGRTIKPSECFNYATSTEENIVYLISESLKYEKEFFSILRNSADKESSEKLEVTFKHLYKNQNKYIIHGQFLMIIFYDYSEVEKMSENYLKCCGLFPCNLKGRDIEMSEWFEHNKENGDDYILYLKTEALTYDTHFFTTLQSFNRDFKNAAVGREESNKKQKSKGQNHEKITVIPGPSSHHAGCDCEECEL